METSLPTISIITVCYNSVQTIEETILSILQQNYPLLDYVIIDGGSTDGTLDIIEKYRNQISYFCSEKDDGISDAFNKGIRHSKGEIIGIVNSDDVLLPHALEHIAEKYNDKIDVYRGNVLIVNKESGKSNREIPSMKFPLIPLVLHIAHPGTFITKKAYEKWGVYSTDLKFNMDHDILRRMYRGKAQFLYIDADLAEFRLGGATSSSIKKKKHDLEYVVKENGGNKFQAKIYYSYMYFVDIIKRIIINTVGIDFLKKLHYSFRLK